ncbi:MAG: DsbA family protein [Nitrosopumilus sp.]|nr:DsbA family protein [Nitrosopumilus sp.]MDH3489581.1 DsbA family protein [Nitrosopumilus sp.]MDH3516579.1 DsbA family protein [Nitrosopumilus sp.]MDH3565046.1 DsbA family protein [Nitrosopumilus sp.]MDH5416469.1 DsbA family protein [Nitrosopumilus sp.]
MSSDDVELNQNRQNMSVKKTTFNVLIIMLIAVVGIAAFFAGSYTSLSSNQIDQEDLDRAIAKIELKILENQLPSKQPTAAVKISIDDDPIIGNTDAPITIIEFSDFQCPFCARFHTQTLPLILEEYIQEGKVKLVFRDFPIQSIHPNALPASMAAECANEQGKFREMHDMLFENQNKWDKQDTGNALALFSQYAAVMKLDQGVFDACLTSGKHIEEIRKDLDDGRDYGVSGTPGFFVGNDQIGYVELKGAQPFESFKKIIDAQLDT